MELVRLICAGIAGGLIGGMGMGGGTLLIPILSLLLAVEQKSAQAVNLTAFIPMAIVSTVINCKNKLVDFKQALWVSVPALATSVAGAFAVEKIQADILRKAFGGFLTVMGGIMIVLTLYRYVKAKRARRAKRTA